MGHLSLSIPEALAILIFCSLFIWAPIFGVAYFRRPFGGDWQNYLKLYLAAASVTVAGFVILALIENARR